MFRNVLLGKMLINKNLSVYAEANYVKRDNNYAGQVAQVLGALQDQSPVGVRMEATDKHFSLTLMFL